MSSLSTFKKKYIGDRQFYMYVLAIAVPMILQNVVTNFVSLIDNLMVGQIGTEEMSGVSIINQYVFLFNLTIFGAVSGPGIFGTQFYGNRDSVGQRYTVRFRIWECTLLALLFAGVFTWFGDPLVSLFLTDDDAPAVVAETLGYGRDYLKIMLWSFVPFAVGQAYASAVRECGETRVPMVAAFSAVGINIVLDYGLIFGKLGMPQLGVEGAAWATVIAKCIEAGVMILWTHTHPERAVFIRGVYRSLYIPGKLFRGILIKGVPLMINEFLWALSMTVVAQCYSVYGIEVVAARNISSVLVNMFSMIYVQLGAAAAIVVGHKLGEGDFEGARDTDNKLVFFNLMVGLGIMLAMLPVAGLFPKLYNTEESVRSLAAFMILVQATVLPVLTYTNVCYFTLRSGGKTLITFLFDFFGSWILMVPVTFVLAYVVHIDIHWLVILSPYTELIKCVAGYFMIRSDMWINRVI